MRRTIAAVLAAMLMFGTMAMASADALDGMFGGLEALAGMLGSEAESKDGLPKLDGEFSGKEIKVKVGGKSIRVHEDFKAAMDEYEAFFDEYAEFMKEPDLENYGRIMSKYLSAMAALEALEERELSDGDTAYLTAVTLRIDKKLLGVIGQ